MLSYERVSNSSCVSILLQATPHSRLACPNQDDTVAELDVCRETSISTKCVRWIWLSINICSGYRRWQFCLSQLRLKAVAAAWVAHTCYRMQGCLVHRGIKTVGREPSWCRLNSEHRKALAPPLFPAKEANKWRPHGYEPPVVRTGQHSCPHPEWKILPARIGCYLNTKSDRHVRCEDNNRL